MEELNENEKRYIDLYNFANDEILQVTSSLRLYQNLKKDSLLEDEKFYYDKKIKYCEAKLDYLITTQSYFIKDLKTIHKIYT